MGSVGGVRRQGIEEVDLLMVRDRATGRFIYTERLERRSGETSWAYVRRSVRRETQMKDRFGENVAEVIVGWNTDSVEDFLESYPEYGPKKPPRSGRSKDERLEGGRVDG